MLGVARSNLIERRDGARPKRGPQDRPGDLGEARGLSPVAQRHPGGTGHRVLPGVRRLHREGTLLRPHHHPRTGHELEELVGVGEPPAQEPGDERHL